MEAGQVRGTCPFLPQAHRPLVRVGGQEAGLAPEEPGGDEGRKGAEFILETKKDANFVVGKTAPFARPQQSFMERLLNARPLLRFWGIRGGKKGQERLQNKWWTF